MITASTITTPAGQLSLLTIDDAVVAAGYTTPDVLAGRLKGPLKAESVVEGPAPTPVRKAVQDYHQGELAALDEVALRPYGTEFQQAVWDALRAIPPGETRSYQQLAAAAGRPSATRAVGTACGANLIAPFIPCHRALRSDGSLGGYEYGLDVKRRLLAHEGSQMDLDTE